MKWRFLTLAVALLPVFACQKAAETPPAAPAPAATDAQSAPPAGSAAPAAAAAPAAEPPKVQVCTLLSAAEVSALMGKTLIQDGCSYDLDPADKQKALADTQDQLAKSQKRAAAGDMSGFMKGMMQAGAGQQNLGNAMKNQLKVTVDASRDDQTEDAIKAIYTKTGDTVRGTLSPEKHGLNGVIQGTNEISGVGDWAFATNVASVNMGAGYSVRGRILQARKGPWHITVGATVAPDPGAAALDGQLASVARALIAKL